LLAEFQGISVHGSVFSATRAGLATAELSLRPAEPEPHHLPHDEAMTELVCDLESRGVDCLTERELLAHRRLANDGRFDVEMWDPIHRRHRQHLPDIACEIHGTDYFIAIEVERRAKNVQIWREILRGFYYRIDVKGLIGVLYVAEAAARPHRISEIASDIGLGERFQLQMNSDADPLDGLLKIVDEHARSV
jgi:hypothetical protein